MKPLNIASLKKAYLQFVVHFLFLVAFTLLCLFFYFHTKHIDYDLLRQQSESALRETAIRKEINTEMERVELKFNWLSQFHDISAEETDDQYSTLASIRDANVKIKDLVARLDPQSNSYQLYKKLTEDLTVLAGTQDSLFGTRFQIASIKSQLDACLRTHRLAEDKLSKGAFRKF